MESDSYVLTLPEIFQLQSIEDIHTKLSEQHTSTINIDASNVIKADSAGLQLLVSLKKSLDQTAGKFQLMEVSDPLTASIKASGLYQLLLSQPD